MVSALAGGRVRIDPAALREFCRRRHIARLALYGSVLRHDFRPESDVDVLIEFEPGHTPGLFTLGGIALELDELVGREVDLKTPADFPEDVRQEVLATAEPLYAAD
jgi:predicted nucleotidyltransferase